MVSWPSTLPVPSPPFGDEPTLPVYKDKFENGFVIPRRQFTRAKRKFELKFEQLTKAQKEAMDAFFVAYQGTVFTWTRPTALSDGTYPSYNVMFGDNSLPFQEEDCSFFSVIVHLEEQ